MDYNQLKDYLDNLNYVYLKNYLEEDLPLTKQPEFMMARFRNKKTYEDVIDKIKIIDLAKLIISDEQYMVYIGSDLNDNDVSETLFPTIQ
jgi:hypothetical protein